MKMINSLIEKKYQSTCCFDYSNFKIKYVDKTFATLHKAATASAKKL